MEVMLVNARHVKNLPGRKTDVGDATWLAQLGAHGQVRGSFVPPGPVRQLRDLTRARTAVTFVDLTADWAMVSKTGRGVPTIDLRVDYHSPATPGDLTVRGKVVRMGSQFSTAEALIYDAQGKLLASGRGTYFTAPPKG